MASTQQVPAEVAARLNDEQKATFMEMMKKAEEGEHRRTSTQVTLRHFSLLQVPEEAKLFSYHDWAGAVVGEYPPVLRPNLPTEPVSYEFEHKANIPGGISKAGVAYSADTRCWVFAWNGSTNQVYIDVVPKGPIDWNHYEKELDASGPSSVYPRQSGVTEAMSHIRDGKASAAFYQF